MKTENNQEKDLPNNPDELNLLHDFCHLRALAHEHNRPPYYTTINLFFKKIILVKKDKGIGWKGLSLINIFVGNTALDRAKAFIIKKYAPFAEIKWDTGFIEKSMSFHWDDKAYDPVTFNAPSAYDDLSIMPDQFFKSGG